MKKLLFILLLSTLAFSQNTQYYIQKAKNLHLAEKRYWHLLLHTDGQESEIDDPDFFLAKNGKFDYKEELYTTIEKLVNETRFDDNATGCRFPARRDWLEKELAITDLPKLECKEFNNLIKEVDPKSVTLVFPFAHINSPASMFGHTFLRIDSSLHSKLVSYAVNYAANADENKENGIVFAIKGLFGGYMGKYSLLPYYDKLKEYGDTEQRDIWEYDLNLNEDEVMRMAKHIWELGNIYSNYYFFDENCSYNMLWLLEIARDGVNLRGQFFYQVSPAETIFAIQKEGLITKEHYRPSKRTVLLAYYDELNSYEIDSVVQLSLGKMAPEKILKKETMIQRKRYVLEAALELCEYFYIERKISKEEYVDISYKLSKARATLGLGEKIEVEQPENPLKAHRQVRFTLQNRFLKDESIQRFGYRATYHDIEDSDIGFLRGTQIEFFDILGKYYDNTTELEHLTLVSIASLVQIDEFFQPFSWRTKFGWDRNHIDGELNFIATVGAGYSYGGKLGYVYLLAEPFYYTSEEFSSGIGMTAGITLYQSRELKLNSEYTKRFYEQEKEQNIFRITENYRLNQEMAVQAKYNTFEVANEEYQGIDLVFNYFY